MPSVLAEPGLHSKMLPKEEMEGVGREGWGRERGEKRERVGKSKRESGRKRGR